VENRASAFPRALTGVPVALHAAIRRDESAFTDLTCPAAHVFPCPAADAAFTAALRDGDRLARAAGAVIAVVTFAASHKACRGPCTGWSEPGCCHWPVAAVLPLAEPVPCRGMPGFWPLPPAAGEAVAAQLPARRETGGAA
jgi:hypothetical protein